MEGDLQIDESCQLLPRKNSSMVQAVVACSAAEPLKMNAPRCRQSTYKAGMCGSEKRESGYMPRRNEILARR